MHHRSELLVAGTDSRLHDESSVRHGRQGADLLGYSYVEQWVRITADSGRGGWMFLGLLGRRERREREASDR